MRFYTVFQTDDDVKYQLITVVYMRLEKVSNDETLLYNLDCVNWLDEEGNLLLRRPS
jgi:hypothetical protein